MCQTRVRQLKVHIICVYVYTLQYQSASTMNYSSYQLFSQLCMSTIHVSCVYATTRRVVRCRSGWRSSRAGPCVYVCVRGGSNVGHYRLSHRAASRCRRAGAGITVQCGLAMSRCMQLRRSAVVTLMTSVTSATAAVASLDSRQSLALRVYIRVYVCTPILYNTLTDCVPTCALYRQCTAAAAALASVCESRYTLPVYSSASSQ